LLGTLVVTSIALWHLIIVIIIVINVIIFYFFTVHLVCHSVGFSTVNVDISIVSVTAFHRPDSPSVAQPPVSKHWMEKNW